MRKRTETSSVQKGGADMTNMKLFAHRGSSTMCPENTMAAFRQAEREGAHGIELDVQLSKDGHPVVIHDRTVTRTTNGRGVVSQLTLHQLRMLDAGSWYNEACRDEKIPTLQEVLEWLKTTDMMVNIELKTDEEPYPGIEQKVLDCINEYDVKDRVVISSFMVQSLQQIRALDPTIVLALLVWEETSGVVEMAQELKADLHTQISFMHTAEAIKAIEQQQTIRLYTVNDLADIQSIDLTHVDALITDVPGALRRAMSTISM